MRRIEYFRMVYLHVPHLEHRALPRIDSKYSLSLQEEAHKYGVPA